MTPYETDRANHARAMRIRRATDVADLAERILVANMSRIDIDSTVGVGLDPVANLGAAVTMVAFGVADAYITERERLRAEAEREP